jgi:CubicO group peptidase (beta-lactamase class C family)
MNLTAWRLADLFAAGIEPAIPYIFSHTTQSYFPFGHFAVPDYPPFGLRSSANDLAKFLLAHLNGGTLGGATILQPATVEMMHTPYYTGEAGQPLSLSFSYETYAYGFGFELKVRTPQQEQYSVGHGGLDFGVATEVHFRPEQGVGVIVLGNAAGGILTAAGVQVIVGRQLPTYSFVPERLLDEAAAALP